VLGVKNSGVGKYVIQIALASIPIAMSALVAALSFLRVADPEEYEELLRRFSRFVKKAYELEKRGRELASRPEEIVDDEVRWLDELEYLYLKIKEVAMDMYTRFRYEYGILDLAKVAEDAYRAAGIMTSYMWRFKKLLDKARYVATRGEPINRYLSEDDVGEIGFLLRNIDMDVHDVVGRRCVWLVGRTVRVENASFAVIVNDITACHHMFTDWLALNFDPELRRVTPRIYEKNGRKELVDLCIEWSRIGSALNNAGVVELSDLAPTRCIVIDNRAYLRVGSAPGHATHIELTDKTLRIEYLDKDEKVHIVLMDLAKRLGIEVVRHRESELTVFRSTIEKIPDVAKLLAFATSMDFRLEAGEQYWTPEPLTRDEYRQIYKKCAGDPVCTEVEVVMKVINENRIAKYLTL
jgi:hypothetical protein